MQKETINMNIIYRLKMHIPYIWEQLWTDSKKLPILQYLTEMQLNLSSTNWKDMEMHSDVWSKVRNKASLGEFVEWCEISDVKVKFEFPPTFLCMEI